MIFLRKCCYCVPLLIGTIIIAIVDMVLDLIAAIIYGIYGGGIGLDLANYLVITFIIIHLFSSALLLYAALKPNPLCMQPYLILTAVKCVLLLILFIVDLCIGAAIICLFLHVLLLVNDIYFWLVVYSIYAFIGGDLVYIDR